jgi:2,3-bisphosphoglycerate-dependent phosphoglycerate mutase
MSFEGRVEDPALTEIGRKQARLAARLLSSDGNESENIKYGTNLHGFHLTHLYTSLMLRAVETGYIIAKHTNVPLTAWTDLHECGGIYVEDTLTGERISRPGKGREFFERRFPNIILPSDLNHDGWWKGPFEEREQRQQRARRVVQELMSRHGGTRDKIGLITHGDFYNHLLLQILDAAGSEGHWFTLNNTGISRVDFHKKYINIVYLNRIDFLPEELIT